MHWTKTAHAAITVRIPLPIHLDSLTITTAARLAGVKSLLQLLQEAMPEFDKRENDQLLRLAQELNFEAEEYFMERRILDEKFRVWLPRFAAYSIILLLHTVLEVQLSACARHVARRTHSKFPQEEKGSGVRASAAYLAEVNVYNAMGDDAWAMLEDLCNLRNIVAHRAGSKGHSKKHLKVAAELATKYATDLKFPDPDKDWPREAWVSLALCNRYADAVEAFLERVVAATRQFN